MTKIPQVNNLSEKEFIWLTVSESSFIIARLHALRQNVLAAGTCGRVYLITGRKQGMRHKRTREEVPQRNHPQDHFLGSISPRISALF